MLKLRPVPNSYRGWVSFHGRPIVASHLSTWQNIIKMIHQRSHQGLWRPKWHIKGAGSKKSSHPRNSLGQKEKRIQPPNPNAQRWQGIARGYLCNIDIVAATWETQMRFEFAWLILPTLLLGPEHSSQHFSRTLLTTLVSSSYPTDTLATKNKPPRTVKSQNPVPATWTLHGDIKFIMPSTKKHASDRTAQNVAPATQHVTRDFIHSTKFW